MNMKKFNITNCLLDMERDINEINLNGFAKRLRDGYMPSLVMHLNEDEAKLADSVFRRYGLEYIFYDDMLGSGKYLVVVRDSDTLLDKVEYKEFIKNAYQSLDEKMYTTLISKGNAIILENFRTEELLTSQELVETLLDGSDEFLILLRCLLHGYDFKYACNYVSELYI